jgi:hypothetical protein
MLSPKRKWGVTLLVTGALVCVLGQYLGSFFILAVALGSLLMVWGGMLFAKSFLEE